jgi:hypothetical protein
MRSCNGCNWLHSIGSGENDEHRMFFCFHTVEHSSSFNQICPCYKCLVKVMCENPCDKLRRILQKKLRGAHP